MIEPDSGRAGSGPDVIAFPPIHARTKWRDIRRRPSPVRRTVTDRPDGFHLENLSASQRTWLEHDLARAAQVQMRLLPDTNLHISCWEVSYNYHTFGLLGGDYCDIMPGENEGNEFLLALGDASGKGIAASLLMAQLHAIFRTLGSCQLPVQELVERANQILCRHAVPSSFATLVCVRATKQGEIEICNAGHCSPLLVGSGGVTPIQAGGLPLGMFSNARCEVTRLRLAKGESLFLYTDGLTEAQDGSSAEYGAERLLQMVQEGSALPPQAMVETCLQSVADFQGGVPSNDDVTVLAMRYDAISTMTAQSRRPPSRPFL